MGVKGSQLMMNCTILRLKGKKLALDGKFSQAIWVAKYDTIVPES
jgi:hypothetical protein